MGPKRRTLESILEQARQVHGDTYDYSIAVFLGTHKKWEIICREHGSFWQVVRSHLDGDGCPQCICIGKEKFIERADLIHNCFYIYDEVVYKNNYTPVIIRCPNHGIFMQRPKDHLNGQGCIKCAHDSYRYSVEEFIEDANLVHNHQYSYELITKITNVFEKKPIICKIHGIFYQTLHSHLCGSSCSKCTKHISKPETEWLDSLNIPIEYRQAKLRINEQLIKPDAFDPISNTVYEFYGDFWHGNPEKFDLADQNKITKKTYGEMFDSTMNKEKLLKEAGYNIISIWENDWNKIKKNME